MNSIFKVVFNKARGALMVVNEATSSVQAKGTKTVIAAAVAALMAGGAMAGNLTYDSIVNNEGTFKFLNGKGEVTNIKTNADANKLFSDLSAAGTDVDEILKALGQVNESKKTGIVFGYAGGGNVMDTTTHALAQLVIGAAKPGWLKGLSQFSKNVDDELAKLNFNLSTHTIVGDVNGDSSPVVLDMVGSDRFINVSLNAPDDLSRDYTITRHGNSTIELQSGNVIGAIGGSSAINVGEGFKLWGGFVQTGAKNTETIVDGNSTINVQGTGCVAGAFAGGSAIAVFDGTANSTVTGNSYFTLNNSKGNEAHGSINTLAAGIAGGGLAIGMASGDAVAPLSSIFRMVSQPASWAAAWPFPLTAAR